METARNLDVSTFLPPPGNPIAPIIVMSRSLRNSPVKYPHVFILILCNIKIEKTGFYYK